MEQLLTPDGYIPLGLCFRWNVPLLVLMVVGNVLLAAAFFAVSAAVVSFMKRSRYKTHHWMFVLFLVSFIICGTAHAIRIWTVWHTTFWLESAFEFLAGVTFLATSALIWPLIPEILALPGPAQLQGAYDELKAEMLRREKAEYRNRQLASIVESSNDAIISFMLNGTVLSWNRGAQDLFGYSVESTMGKTLRHLIGPDMDTVIEVLREGRKLDTIETTFQRADGKTVYLSLCVSPIKNEQGQVVNGAAIFRDISQTKLAEKQLLRTSEQLAQSNKELEEFAWVAAHDLKEPVRTMATYSKLLDQEYDDKLDDSGRQYLEFIHGSAVKAMARIDDVLEFSAVGRGKFVTHPIELNTLVESVLQDLRLAIDEANATINVAELPIVKGKSEYISSLFQNILSNAIKYRGKEPPVINVSAVRDGDFWRFSMSDNGIGFDMQNINRIFQMFQRLHHEDEYPGSGLGLAMCKKIVELHGGKIWAESEAGKGATFFFTLPALESDKASSVSTKTASSPAKSN